MNTPTYKEQFDKITRAYIANELNPLENCACFIGNLLNNKSDWAFARYHCGFGSWEFEINIHEQKISEKAIYSESNGLYTIYEIYGMEKNFLDTYDKNGARNEDSLFHAMESTLEMLKQIHISNGEQVDEIPFTKRQLFPA